jgi:hypothetical protein
LVKVLLKVSRKYGEFQEDFQIVINITRQQTPGRLD